MGKIKGARVILFVSENFTKPLAHNGKTTDP